MGGMTARGVSGDTPRQLGGTLRLAGQLTGGTVCGSSAAATSSSIPAQMLSTSWPSDVLRPNGVVLQTSGLPPIQLRTNDRPGYTEATTLPTTAALRLPDASSH